MNTYYIKYKCKDDKYNSTINIMSNFNEKDIIIKDWYIALDIGIIILESSKNLFHIRLRLNKYFDIINAEKIDKVNDWLNNYETN
jgi:hypothetical protein|tara:strand:+ start:380 stop:634 length:255 start_codon:yes stop_codon:yes gene_type:complete